MSAWCDIKTYSTGTEKCNAIDVNDASTLKQMLTSQLANRDLETATHCI